MSIKLECWNGIKIYLQCCFRVSQKMLFFCLLGCAPVGLCMLTVLLENTHVHTHTPHIHAPVWVQLLYIQVQLFFFFFEKLWVMIESHFGFLDAVTRSSSLIPYMACPCSPQFCHHLALGLSFACHTSLSWSAQEPLSFLQLQGPLAYPRRDFCHMCFCLVCYLRRGLQGAQGSAHVQN